MLSFLGMVRYAYVQILLVHFQYEINVTLPLTSVRTSQSGEALWFSLFLVAKSCNLYFQLV